MRCPKMPGQWPFCPTAVEERRRQPMYEGKRCLPIKKETMNDQLRTDLQKINDRLQTLQVRL